MGGGQSTEPPKQAGQKARKKACNRSPKRNGTTSDDIVLIFQHFNTALQEKLLMPSFIIQNLQDLKTTFCPEYSIALGKLETTLLNAGDAHHQAFNSVNAFCKFLIPIMEEVSSISPDGLICVIEELQDYGEYRFNEANIAFKKCLEALNKAEGMTTFMLTLIHGDVTDAQNEYNGIFQFFRSRGKLDKLEKGFEEAKEQIKLAKSIIQVASKHIEKEQNHVEAIRVPLQVLSTTMRLPIGELKTMQAQKVIAEARKFQQLRQATCEKLNDL